MSNIVSFKDVSLNFGGVKALNNVSFDIKEGESIVTSSNNQNEEIKTIKTTNKGTVFWRLLVNTADEISKLDEFRRTTVCEYR